MTNMTSSTSEQSQFRQRFGNILKKIRKVRGRSIYELADAAKVDAGYISRLENAHRNPPSPKILQRFANALNVQVDLLMMAAGYLEYDPAGRPIDSEEIIRRVEAELTAGRPGAKGRRDILPSDKARKEIKEILNQLDAMKQTLLDALKAGPST